MKTRALAAAFPLTLPVMAGFSFLGIAFGILMAGKGYAAGWAVLMSLVVFAGSAQYLALTFLSLPFEPLAALLLTLLVNSLHVFYGLSLLDKYKGAGRFKPYLIFGLCDETFSIVCSARAPEGVDEHWFRFFITALNHSYWVLGTAAGSLLGLLLPMDLAGMDFALTALFVVIFVSQWKSTGTHWPALAGLGCTGLALLLLGPGQFIVPALVMIFAVLSLPWAKRRKGGGAC